MTRLSAQMKRYIVDQFVHGISMRILAQWLGIDINKIEGVIRAALKHIGGKP